MLPSNRYGYTFAYFMRRVYTYHGNVSVNAIVRISARQRARNQRKRMVQQDPEEVLMRALMAAGGNIDPKMADHLVEEGIASTNKHCQCPITSCDWSSGTPIDFIFCSTALLPLIRVGRRTFRSSSIWS